MKHGTISAYTNQACRCERCRKANNRYKAAYAANERRELKRLRRAAGVKS